MQIKIQDQAQGRWQSIMINLGMDANLLTGKHTECPLCQRNKKFRFDDKEGSGSFICICENGYGVQLVMSFLSCDFVSAVKEIRGVLGISTEKAYKKVDNQQEIKQNQARLKRIQEGCEVITRGSAAARYFQKRGVKCSAAKNIKLNNEVPYYDDGNKKGMFPCVVSTISDKDGNPATFHLTYLADDGKKLDVEAPKKVLPKIADWSGGAVRLFDANDGVLAIAEGIETALAVNMNDGLPCWATVTANGMEKFILPENIHTLYIYADSDTSFTGQAAAYALAKRLRNKNRELKVKVVMLVVTNHIESVIDEGLDLDYLDMIEQSTVTDKQEI